MVTWRRVVAVEKKNSVYILKIALTEVVEGV